MTEQSRRLTLKGLAFSLPAVWTTPLVNAVILPAHAETSPEDGGEEVTLTAPFTTGPIADETSNVFTAVVSTPATSVSDATLDLDITHTWIGDLDISLTSPEGTTEDLIQGICAGADNMLLTLDDSASTSVASASCPPTSGGSFSPSPGMLSGFNGEDPNGTWTLTIADTAAADTGTLNSATLNLTAS